MPRGTSGICPWTYTQYLMHDNCYRNQDPSSKCLRYPHHQPGEMRSLCKVNSTYAQQWPKSHASFSCHNPPATLEKCIPQLHFNSWWVTLSWNYRMLNSLPKNHYERKLDGVFRMLWKSACHVLQLKCTCAWPSSRLWRHKPLFPGVRWSDTGVGTKWSNHLVTGSIRCTEDHVTHFCNDTCSYWQDTPATQSSRWYRGLRIHVTFLLSPPPHLSFSGVHLWKLYHYCHLCGICNICHTTIKSQHTQHLE